MDEARIFKVPEDQCHIGLKWVVKGNQSASKEAGRDIYDKVLEGELLAPGQQKSMPVVEILRIFPDGKEKRSIHYPKYKAQAEAFMGNDAGGDLAGTPIDKCPLFGMEIAAQFKAMKIYTVEQVRDISDTAKQHFGMGASEWQAKARNWLAAAADGAIVGKLTAELAQRDTRIAELERQMVELGNRLTTQEERRGPGRPRKA
jgi:hypothetical protein